MAFLLIISFSFCLPNFQFDESSEKLNLLLSTYVDSVGNVNYDGIINCKVDITKKDDIVKFIKNNLNKKKIDILINAAGITGNTPLMWAAYAGQLEVVKFLNF